MMQSTHGCRRRRQLGWILSALLGLGCKFDCRVESFPSQSVSALRTQWRSRCIELRANARHSASSNLDQAKRIFCISDLHTDSDENMAWLEDKCVANKDKNGPGKDDILVVAGDISHKMITFQRTFKLLLSLGCHVFFVPGNHEAWLSAKSKKHRTSLDKMELVEQTCHHLGVHTECALIGSANPYPIWLAPLQSWYDGSLSIEECEDLCTGFSKWPWTDFLRCRWPADRFPPLPKTDKNARIPLGLNEYFLECNEEMLEDVRDDPSTDVLTVSHFLPNSQCLPDWKDLESPVFLRDEWLDHGAAETSAKFAKVAGSSALDDQVRSLMGPSRPKLLHVFGHSHRPKDFEFHNVRYVHNPLGKPRERNFRMVSPNVDFQLLWDTRTGEVEGQQLLRYWEEKGGGAAALQERLREQKLQRKQRLEAWSRRS